MRKVIYSMGVSLDGFIAGPDGAPDLVPDAELHRFHNEQTRELGVHLYGRRLYETMSAWEDYAEQHPSAAEHELEFERIWKQTPKIVFSTTLERVAGDYRLADRDVAEEVERLKQAPGKDIAVGGAGLAASLLRLGLIDELQPVVHPVVLGGGVPYLPRDEAKLELRLIETRTFGMGAVHLRYALVR